MGLCQQTQGLGSSLHLKERNQVSWSKRMSHCLSLLTPRLGDAGAGPQDPRLWERVMIKPEPGQVRRGACWQVWVARKSWLIHAGGYED